MLRGLTVIAGFSMVDDARWRESVLWSICRFLLRHTPKTLSLGPLAEVVVLATPFVPQDPCLVRSVWWRALLRHTSTGIDWLGLIAQHGWDGGFRPEDLAAEAYGDGKTARPLVEGLVQAVAKQLLETVVLPDELVLPWLDRLRDLAARYPDWNFLPYYHARLLFRLDRTTEAMQVFLPFARQKQREFWVWSMLAELVSPGQIAACFAQALSLGTPETFLVKVRQRVAAWLITQDRWSDARAEIDRLLQARQENGWPVPPEVQHWLSDARYIQAPRIQPGQWYGPLLAEAARLLWQDCPETVALVTALDTTGRYVTVAIDARLTGSFPVQKFGLQPVVGDRLALRYSQQEVKGRMQLRVQTAVSTEVPLTNLQLKTLVGPLRMAGGRGVGFVGPVYVPSDLLKTSAVSADVLVKVDAVASWDSVKKLVGWRAFLIQQE